MKILTKNATLLFILALWCGSISAQISFTNQNTWLGSISGGSYEDCAVDMNDDGLDDVVRVTSSKIYIDYQLATGGFTQQEFDVNMTSSPSWSMCAGDIDNNGFNDLLFGDGSSCSFIYANDDGTAYTEVPGAAYIFSQRTTLSDIDNDGNLDAFICHDVDQSHPYRNDGNGNLTLDQTLIETADLAGNYAAIWVDYDNDGDSDLYITKCRQGSTSGDIERTNLLYRDNGDGTYTDVAEEANMDDNAQSWATVFEDFDNDGDFDAFIVNHDFKNRFKLNNGDGTFSDMIETTGIAEYDLGAWENASGDFNNDGFVDILSELSKEIYLNNGDLTFTGYDISFDDGGIGDFNNDGFLDVVKGNSLMINDGNDNNWVKFTTQGIVSNRNGIGARIEIHGDWGIQIREVRSGQSFSPMSSLAIHFGIADATSINQVIVKWPSGMVTTLENPDINTTHHMIESSCLLDAEELTVNGETQICEGQEVTITAPDGYSYNWSNGESTQSITVSTAGSYSAVLTNDDDCLALTNNVVVTVIEDVAPSISLDGDEQFCQGGSATLTSSNANGYTWSNGLQTQSIEITETGDYFVVAEGSCSGNQLASESISINVLDAPAPTVDNVNINLDMTATLSVIGDGIQWFAEANGGTPLGQGNIFTSPVLSENTTYYAESTHEYGGATQEGGKLNNDGGGGIPGTGAYSIFDAYEPFTLLTVSVYVPDNGEAGIRDIQLVDESGTILAEESVDLNGPGEYLVILNFEVPAANGLSLRCPQNNLFRNDNGVDYPYAIGDVGTIHDSFYGQQYYYYFYNWQIQKDMVSCISDRTPVLAELTVGVTALEDISNLSLFPNPANDVLTISFESSKNSSASFQLFDVLGRQVLNQSIENIQIGENTSTLELKNLADGVYNLQMTIDDKHATYKVVVQK